MILSFAWTTEQYESGIKTCTRRLYRGAQFERWCRAWDSGRHVHQAWSRVPFVAGARRLPDFRLTCRPYRQRLADMPLEDLIAEGNLWLSLDEFIALFGDRELCPVVIRFEVLCDPRKSTEPTNLTNWS